jgi:hypothetical protein
VEVTSPEQETMPESKLFFFLFFFTYLTADQDLVNGSRHARLEAEAAAEHAQVREQLAREAREQWQNSTSTRARETSKRSVAIRAAGQADPRPDDERRREARGGDRSKHAPRGRRDSAAVDQKGCSGGGRTEDNHERRRRLGEEDGRRRRRPNENKILDQSTSCGVRWMP